MGRCAGRNRSIKMLSNGFEKLQKKNFTTKAERVSGSDRLGRSQGLTNNVKIFELLCKSKME